MRNERKSYGAFDSELNQNQRPFLFDFGTSPSGLTYFLNLV